MSEFKSLRKNWEFQAVYRNGKSKANRCFVMIIKKNDTSSTRVGISVSKKVGNSIVRHRVTRVIREVMRLHWGEIKSGYDIVIVARPSAKDSDFGFFDCAFFHLLYFLQQLPVYRPDCSHHRRFQESFHCLLLQSQIVCMLHLHKGTCAVR